MVSQLRWTHGVGDVIGYTFAKHWGGQPGVDVLGVQVLILAVEHQRGRVAAQQVGERTPHHGETEHRAVLWVDSRDTQPLKQCTSGQVFFFSLVNYWILSALKASKTFCYIGLQHYYHNNYLHYQ